MKLICDRERIRQEVNSRELSESIASRVAAAFHQRRHRMSFESSRSVITPPAPVETRALPTSFPLRTWRIVPLRARHVCTDPYWCKASAIPKKIDQTKSAETSQFSRETRQRFLHAA